MDKRLIAIALSLAVAGCGGPTSRSDGDNGNGTSNGNGTDNSNSGNPDNSGNNNNNGNGNPNCVNLQCQQHACGELGTTTTISGTVYDPAGNNPLYNVVVFVPNSTPKPLPSGASCDSCSSLYTGDPVVVALTDATGKFTLTDAPDGNNIPLVIQVGKWRRQITIPLVHQCQDNALPDKSLTLPKNTSEGDIPNIAISTGRADTLECLLVRVGIDQSEYVGGSGSGGRIHIFSGGSDPFGGLFGGGGGGANTSPPGPASSQGLWDSKADLMPYDMVLLSCEGSETSGMNQQALHDYTDAGGRVFASHFHYAWFDTGPFGNENLASWSTGSQDIGDISAVINTMFPKGKIFSDWLGNVGALMNGELPIQAARHNADVSAANTPSQTWILADNNSQAPGAAQYFSFDTPTNAPKDAKGNPAYCGRVVYSDLHVGAASGDYGGGGGHGGIHMGGTVPSGCAANQQLSAQEKALEFMLFDLSSCVTPDSAPPAPPIPPVM